MSSSSTATAVKSFTLEVPANNQALHDLIWQIMDEAENGDERINLHFGTNSLLCEDEQEREEHRNNVTANYAIQTLMSAFNAGCNNGGESGPEDG
jgi:hypothetical protein